MGANLVAVIYPNSSSLDFLRKLCAAAGIAEPLITLSPCEAAEFILDHLSEILVVFVVQRQAGAALAVLDSLHRCPLGGVPLILIADPIDAELELPAMQTGASGLIIRDERTARSAEILSSILEHADRR